MKKMDPSYTNPLGGQFQPTDYSANQGDIILTPSQPRKLDLKRILTLVGIGLAVLALFVVVIMVISNNNRTASEAKAADREEKVVALEDLYNEYGRLLTSYATIGNNPVENMADELEDTSKFFVIKKATLAELKVLRDGISNSLTEISNTDLSILGDAYSNEAYQIVQEIRSGLENINNNISTLSAFYDAFVLPIYDLDADTAARNCSFSVTIDDMDELTVDGFLIEDAIEGYNRAYCVVNDEIYYDIFSGYFDSPYIYSAKESLIKTLLINNSQSDTLEKFRQLLGDIGSENIKKYEPDNIVVEEDNED